MAGSDQTRWTAVLFDFDGTLGDSIDLIISSVRATAAELPDTPSMRRRYGPGSAVRSPRC
jgi:phosphoglycolate phosphatase-like HAD superfamily hydrolase